MTTGNASILGVGLYTIPEAGRLVDAPTRTVRAWVSGGLARSPVQRHAGRTTLLSFHDLISLLVVRGLQRRHVRLKKIKQAERHLRQDWGVAKPLATKHIWTDGRTVIARLGLGDTASAITDATQEILLPIVEKDLHDVTYDAHLEAEAWMPTVGVLLRPDVQFGAPCIPGTRITTSTIFDLIETGDEAAAVAEDYEIDVEKIVNAYSWEKQIRRDN